MEIRHFLKSFFQHIYSFTAIGEQKHHCIMCGEPSETRICEACEAYWPLQTQYCQSCALPLTHHALYCGDCLKQTPDFDKAYAPYIYAAPLSQLILKFKNHHDMATGLALCSYWQYRLKQYYRNQHLSLPDYLAPVPTHWRRQWQRGFSHTQFLAEQLHQYLSIPIFNETTIPLYTHSQKSLTRQQRLKLLSSAFVVNATLIGKTVAIIDDVMTTGATANAFAKALKKAGASDVIVWVLARTPKKP